MAADLSYYKDGPWVIIKMAGLKLFYIDGWTQVIVSVAELEGHAQRFPETIVFITVSHPTASSYFISMTWLELHYINDWARSISYLRLCSRYLLTMIAFEIF